MKTIAGRLALLLGCTATFAVLTGHRPAPATLEGQVMNRASSRPVPGATVALTVEDERTTTDETGRFTFGGVDVRGPDTLVITHPEFPTTRLPLGYPERSRWQLTIHLIPYTITTGDPRASSSARGDE